MPFSSTVGLLYQYHGMNCARSRPSDHCGSSPANNQPSPRTAEPAPSARPRLPVAPPTANAMPPYTRAFAPSARQSSPRWASPSVRSKGRLASADAPHSPSDVTPTASTSTAAFVAPTPTREMGWLSSSGSVPSFSSPATSCAPTATANPATAIAPRKPSICV